MTMPHKTHNFLQMTDTCILLCSSHPLFSSASLASGLLLGKSHKRLKLAVVSIPNLVCPVFITCESNIMHCNSKSKSSFFQLHTSCSTESLNWGGGEGGGGNV